MRKALDIKTIRTIKKTIFYGEVRHVPPHGKPPRQNSANAPQTHHGVSGHAHLYSKLRRTDFLPSGEEREDEVLQRGYDSLSSDDEDGRGLEYAWADKDDNP